MLAVVFAEKLLNKCIDHEEDVHNDKSDAYNFVESEPYRAEDDQGEDEDQKQDETKFGMWCYRHLAIVEHFLKTKR